MSYYSYIMFGLVVIAFIMENKSQKFINVETQRCALIPLFLDRGRTFVNCIN